MNKRVIDGIFFLMIFALSFWAIPESLRCTLIGGILVDKLVLYPMLCGIIYTLYCWGTRSFNFVYFKYFICFVAAYFVVNMVSLFLGLSYLYGSDELFRQSATQYSKVILVADWVKRLGMTVKIENLFFILLSLNAIKGLVLEILYGFFCSYMIFCWYKDDWRRAVKIFVYGISSSLILIFIFGCIELSYLGHCVWAKEILVKITPWFHVVNSGGTWWPQLLYSGGMRTFFAEPSFMCLYLVFVIPTLWYMMWVQTKISYKFIVIMLTTVVMTFFVFMSNARTGLVLYLGELFILTVFVVLKRDVAFLKKYIVVLFTVIFGYGCCYFFMNNIMGDANWDVEARQMQKITVAEYVHKNITSAFNSKERSNPCRYSVTMAEFKIGMDNPVFGVGRGFRKVYIYDKIPDDKKDFWEIKYWHSEQVKKGVLKSGWPGPNEYTARFAETGVLGLIVFLLPVFYLMYLFVKNYAKLMKQDFTVFYTVIIGGVLASGFSTVFKTSCIYWIVLAMGFIFVYSEVNSFGRKVIS